MKVISDNNYLLLGLQDFLSLHEEGLENITMVVSTDSKVIRMFNGVQKNQDEYFSFMRFFNDFIFSCPLNNGLESFHQNLKMLTLARTRLYLTPREIEVTMNLLYGRKVGDIALMYGSSSKTISGQKRTAFKKLHVNSIQMLHREILSVKSSVLLKHSNKNL